MAGETDKEGKTWLAPVTAKVRTALVRIVIERPGIGAAYLSITQGPNAADHKGTGRSLTPPGREDCRAAEASGWSLAFDRRKWATARKGLPLPDVAQAGGWRSQETLARCYQQPDDVTMLTVVLGRVDLREMKA